MAAETTGDDSTLARYTVSVDFGQDVGQSFGTIFESRSSDARVVVGAGFMDVYNTHFRAGRRMLQFFVRTKETAEKFSVERLPHPDLDCGVYLFNLDEQVFAWSSVRGNAVRRWDEASNRWLDDLPHRMPMPRSGDVVMRLGKGLLVMAHNQVVYNDRTVLSPPEKGNYYNFYYALGRLFFYHTVNSEAEKFTKIYACPWTPAETAPVSLSQASVIETKYAGETPFAWGQFEDTVLTVSNQGGIYAFQDHAWKTLLEADNAVSYQVYSMLNNYDRLLLAQSPSGHLFEYTGDDVPKELDSWPPRLPGVSSSAREAQTLGIYRGDLFVGVWPWAELWRYDHGEAKWHSIGRMFTHPNITDKRVHPYEAAAEKYGLVTNHWGQRVTGMVPLGDAMLLSTSSKGTGRWEDQYDFLTEQQRREYGAVLRLKMPGNLSAPITWTGKPTKFEFIFTDRAMIMRQDGHQMAAAPFQPPKDAPWDRLDTTWGHGVFGRFSGELLSKERTR